MLAPLHLVLCAASLNNRVEIMRNNSIESYMIVEESKESESIHHYRMTPDPLTLFLGTLLSSSFHRFAVGFRSRDKDGLILWSLNHSLYLVICFESLSCWKSQQNCSFLLEADRFGTSRS